MGFYFSKRTSALLVLIDTFFQEIYLESWRAIRCQSLVR
jgi:hypothetical protein